MDQIHQIMQRDLLERAPVPELTTVNGVIMSVVYVTARPTFTGVIGGLTTLSPDTTSTQSSALSRNTATASPLQTTTSARSSSSLSLSTSATLASTALSTSVASFTYGQGQSTQTASSGSDGNTSASSSSSSSSNSGISLGAKIGLAVGIICAIGVIASLILLLLARKRRQMKKQAQGENEKKSPGIPSHTTQFGAQQSPIAPRLSLRPVSRLVPEFMGGSQQRNRSSQGNMLAPINEGNNNRSRNASPSHELVERVKPVSDRSRPAENPFRDPENPFVDPEKALHIPQSSATSPVSPIGPAATFSNKLPQIGAGPDQRMSGPSAESFPIPHTQGHTHIAGPVPTPAPASRSGLVPAPISVPAVTTHYELPAAPSPVVAQGPGPELPPQGNVYRILMDFRPTMEDELELRSGQLVRMLHEYDDGWALCIRLDRSQQGVVPRTCLAAKPSKPRPGPPPSGPASRPMTPPGRPRGTTPVQGSSGPVYNPAPMRAQSPAIVNENTGAFNQPPRPLSPGPRPQIQARSMSPGPYVAGGPPPMAAMDQRRRSNSVGNLNVRDMRNIPAGASRLGPSPLPVRSTSPGLAI